MERDIEERCREYCASVEGRLKDIEEKLQTKTNEEQVKEIVKECLKNEETIEIEKDNITDTINKLMDERSTETKERETRRNNVIIFGQKRIWRNPKGE